MFIFLTGFKTTSVNCKAQNSKLECHNCQNLHHLTVDSERVKFKAIYLLPAAPPQKLVGHTPVGPHSMSSLQDACWTQPIGGTIGSLHLQKFCVIPVWKHHPPGQSWLVWQLVLSMHVAWGSGVVDISLHLHSWGWQNVFILFQHVYLFHGF